MGVAPLYGLCMPRPRRAAEGGLIYHALNRANARLPIFDSDADYVAFERVLHQAVARFDMRLLAYCLMPNHFHLLLWPHEDGELSTFMRLAGHDPHPAFARPPPDRRDRPSVSGPVQVIPGAVGRASSDGVPLRRTQRPAGEPGRARGGVEMGGLSARRANNEAERPTLTSWPIERTRDWTARLSRPFGPRKEEAMLRSMRRGQPFGSECWQADVAARLGLASSLRPRVRPRQPNKGSRLLSPI